MKVLFIITLLFCLNTAVFPQRGILDSNTNTMLISIPESYFGTDKQITINGKEYTFNHIEANKMYPVENFYVTFTFLPIIQLTGEFGYDYQNGTVTFYMPDGSVYEHLNGKLKWRGGSTNTADKHKRNYKIKFSEDYSFFGMRNDNKWILDAGQADIFRLRNRIATDLWNDFSVKPYYIEQESKAMSGVRGEIVEVFLNNEYIGIYSFTECLDRKQMKLKKFESNGTIHGTLWKSTGFGSSMMYDLPDTYDNSQPTWDVFEAKYPELDDLPETDYSTLWNAINFVVNSSDDEFRSQISQYFDIPVLIDYYLFINLLNGFDNTGKNMYWAVYDKITDKKITFAVWDLDLTVGSHYLDYYRNGLSAPDIHVGNALNVIERLKDLDVENFNQKVTERYKELRNSYFSTQDLINRYYSYYELLKNSGAAQREQNRWSGDSDILNATIDFDLEYQYIENWITNHVQYLDNNVFNYQGSTAINHVIKKQNTTPIYNINGQPVNNHQKGIIIKNRKKYAISH